MNRRPDRLRLGDAVCFDRRVHEIVGLDGIDDLILRLLNSSQPFVQIARIAPDVQAGHYHAAVGLATLLIQPAWVNRATSKPSSWKRATAQLAAARAIECRLTDYTYIRLSRWNHDHQLLGQT